MQESDDVLSTIGGTATGCAQYEEEEWHVKEEKKKTMFDDDAEGVHGFVREASDRGNLILFFFFLNS